jgi:hypothetical protein
MNTFKGAFEKKVYTVPETGTVIVGVKQFEVKTDPFFQGRYISIDNKEESIDIVAVVTYKDSKYPIVGHFIQNKSGMGIPLKDGDYDLYIHSGQNWNPITKKFERNPYFYKWDDSFLFPPKVIGENVVARKIFIETMDKPFKYNLLGASIILETDFPYIV